LVTVGPVFLILKKYGTGNLVAGVKLANQAVSEILAGKLAE